MITTMDVEKAEKAEAAVRERTALLRMSSGGAAVERARRQAEEVREGKAKQDAALEARTAAVTPHAAELKKLAAGCDKSASAVAEAAREAVEALRRLLAVTEAHTGAVGAVHARLTELALPLVDECSEYEEGAGAGGVVRVGGRSYGPVPPDAVFSEVVGRLARELFGEYHPAAQVVRSLPHHVVSNSAAGRELFGRLPGA